MNSEFITIVVYVDRRKTIVTAKNDTNETMNGLCRSHRIHAFCYLLFKLYKVEPEYGDFYK